VLCDNADWAIWVEKAVGGHVIDGNVSCRNGSGGFYFPGPGAGDAFTGNLSYDDGGAALDGRAPLTSDGNTYWKIGGAPLLRWSGTSHAGLAAFRAASGQDAHSRVADPGKPDCGPRDTLYRRARDRYRRAHEPPGDRRRLSGT
jgi:hypothetical protein